jgi:PAS domain S-box-containing protein/putative nucleotidyltransferase with HDIG domain
MPVEDALEVSQRYDHLFENMLEGLAHIRMLLDEGGHPVDWVYLDVNPAFERLTGLRGVIGRTISQVLPQTLEENPELLEIYGRVAAGGEPEEFEIAFRPLGLWLCVSVFSPAPGEVVALFDDVTPRRVAEREARLFSSAVENASVSVMIVDPGARITRVNRRACEVLRHSAETLCAMTLADIDPAFSADRWPAFQERLRVDGPQCIVRDVRVGAADERVPLELHLSLVTVGQNELMVAFAHEIGDRLAAERALHERERVLSTLMNNLPGMAYRCADDGDWTMEFVSAGCEELTGYAPEALVGSAEVAFGDLIVPEHRQRVARTVAGAVETNDSWTQNYAIATATGEEKWVWERGVAVRGPAGEVQALEGLITDITALHDAEVKLDAAASEWRQTFDAMGDAVALLDDEGRVVRCNAATLTHTGRDFGEILGRHCHEVFHDSSTFHPDCPQRRARLSGQTESTLVGQGDGCLRMSFQPLFDQAGVASGGVHVITDVSDLKQAERELVVSLEAQRAITDGVIAALARTVEARDPYTAGHQRRVAELAAAIARQQRRGDDFVRGLSVAAMLHDVGKIVVPSEILSKPGRLSANEFELIKGHAQAGYDILRTISFPWPVADIAVQHHERLDGSGYPAGLTDGQILPEARILAVADVVEAMISHRPYRAALPLDVAMAELEEGAGSRYEAAVCSATIELFRQRGFTFAE